ncbi:MAG: hypothetical protein ACKV2T_39975 [Kofleriaceae bacterium]
MRAVVLGALALGSGCNWVFGLDPVRLTDAQIIDVPPDARLPTVKLSAITPILDPVGGTTEQATFVPITPAPRVQYGRIGEALVDTVYTSQDVPVGYDFAEAAEPWRLVYTLDGGVPHEVHWKPSETMRPGHAVTVQLTPNDRDPVPSSGSFRLAPTSPPSAWGSETRVYTTNAWTANTTPARDAAGVTSDYVSSRSKAIAGPKRKPDPAKDFEVLLDYNVSTAEPTCDIVTGAAAFRIDLATGVDDGVPQMFKRDDKPGDYTITANTPFTPISNLALANGLNPLVDITTVQLVTYGPAGGIPMYHHREDVVGTPVPAPPGMLLARCINGPPTLPLFGYPLRVVLETIGTLVYTTRPMALAGGSPLVRNLISVSIMSELGPFNVIVANLTFPIDPVIDATPVNITTATEVSVPPGGTTATLDFGLGGTSPLIDLYEATLYRVEGAELVPVREFTFTEKPLRFDRDQGLPAGTRYVFAIRTIRGASANVVNADFSVWGNTQALGLTHTQIFRLD